MRRVFAIVSTVEAWLIATAMIALACLAIANVFSRNVLDHGLAFAEEISQFLVVLVCFVGLSYAAGRGRHIRMTALYDQLPKRWRKALMVVIATTTSAVMFGLAYVAFRYAWSVDSVSPVLRVPLRIVYFAAPLGLTLCGVQYAATAVRNLTSPDVYLSFEVKDEYEAPIAGEI